MAEVMGLPRITQIAAGRHQAILSDGERVWTMGTWMDKTGHRVGRPTQIYPILFVQQPSFTCSCNFLTLNSGRLGFDGFLTRLGCLPPSAGCTVIHDLSCSSIPATCTGLARDI